MILGNELVEAAKWERGAREVRETLVPKARNVARRPQCLELTI
jgi:hypothetical protein